MGASGDEALAARDAVRDDADEAADDGSGEKSEDCYRGHGGVLPEPRYSGVVVITSKRLSKVGWS